MWSDLGHHGMLLRCLRVAQVRVPTDLARGMDVLQRAGDCEAVRLISLILKNKIEQHIDGGQKESSEYLIMATLLLVWATSSSTLVSLFSCAYNFSLYRIN